MKKTSDSYCHKLLGLKILKSRALTNLIMSLASNDHVSSVTELSLSPVYHYQYSSLCDAIDSLASNESEYLSMLQLVQGFVWDYYEVSPCAPLLLQTDVTPIVKRHSPTLCERGYISIPNTPIGDNKPLDIGYHLSSLNVGIVEEGWSIPLDMRRVQIDETPADVALAQLNHLKEHPAIDLSNRLIINALDSAYGSASFLSRAYEFEEMLQIVRLRHGRSVWAVYEGIQPKGRQRRYGEAYSLIEHSQWKQFKKHPKTGKPYEKYYRSIYETPSDDVQIIPTQTRKGRAIEIHLHRWNNYLMRTKRGFQMGDKPFDLVACRVLDAQTQERVFEKDLFLAIWGKKKQALSTANAYGAYRGRSDIEGYFRFAKQRMLLEQFQTPDRQHLDNWFICQILAAWLLYSLRKEAQFVPRKWEKYLAKYQENEPETKQKKRRTLSSTQTQRAALKVFLNFDPTPFKPQKSKKGRPRRKGESQKPRKRFPVVKKKTKWYAYQYENP